MGEASGSIEDFLARIAPAKRRADAERLLILMARATGASPQLYDGRRIGFGRYHYRYESGREGDAPAAGFAPAKAATTIYVLDGVGRYAEQLERLGPHRAGVGCIYITDLDRIDLDVLEAIVAESFRTLTSETYTLRAREGHGN